MKAHARRYLLITVFAAFSLLLLFYPSQGVNEKLVLKSSVISKISPGAPVRLIIPQININTDIKYMGVTPYGVMEVPDNIMDVGWFKLGPHPGEKGSAVIAGHFDGKNGEAGVFTNLYKLKKGDKLYIEDDKRVLVTFIVRERRIYDPGSADEVFSSSDSAHLNLVTCDGVWDGAKKSYSKRLVVFADIAPN